MKIIKWMSRALCALVLAVMAATLVAAPALAKPDEMKSVEPYTYRVRVYAGNKGTVNGNDKYAEITKIPAGTQLVLSEKFEVEAKDGYYFKGFRTGGYDNLDGVANKTAADNIEKSVSDTITVDRDLDFVVSYGYKKAAAAKLTIKFVDEKGAAIKDDKGNTSVTFDCAAGDKPVVAYHYCPGYRPSYRTVTGTLKAGENSMSLPYKKIETTASSTSSSKSTSSSSSSSSKSTSSSSSSSSKSSSSNTTTKTTSIVGIKMVNTEAAAGIVEAVAAETESNVDFDKMTDEEIQEYRNSQKPSYERLNPNSFGFVPMAIVLIAVVGIVGTIIYRVIADRHDTAEA